MVRYVILKYDKILSFNIDHFRRLPIFKLRKLMKVNEAFNCTGTIITVECFNNE